jgi:predicted cupin superfamily sugar epimerase
MFQFTTDGESEITTIGNDIFNDEIPQVIVPNGVWQGTKLKEPKEGAWALLGCTVAPGFEIENFHIESRSELIQRFPHLKEQITRFTN